jgi:hypothetical protein
MTNLDLALEAQAMAQEIHAAAAPWFAAPEE